MKLKLINVSPLEALSIVQFVEDASKRLGIEDFTLVLLRGEGNLKKELGDNWTPETADFYALHIALDTPTVYVRLDLADRDLLTSAIYHELGHALLHGSPEYYRIPVPLSLLKLGSLATRILYLLSIAVKDFEVSRLLASRGLSETQNPLLREMLRPEPIPWDILGREELTLALASSMKSIMFSIPLVNEGTIKRSLKVPDQLLQMALNLSREMGYDTMENIRLASARFLELVMHFSLMN